MTRLHPLLVHFPIALLFTHFIFVLLGQGLKRPSLMATARHLLMVGTIGAALAVVTGLAAAVEVRETPVPSLPISIHMVLGIITLFIAAVLMVWSLLRGSSQGAAAARVYLSVAAAGLALALATGYMGERLVFEYGAAVQMEGLPEAR